MKSLVLEKLVEIINLEIVERSSDMDKIEIEHGIESPGYNLRPYGSISL